MLLPDPSQIEALHAAARRERAHYLHCLLIRAGWLRALLPHGVPAAQPCCEPA